MAFPIVEATNTSNVAAAASHSVALPASIQIGEMLLIFVAQTTTAVRTLTTPAGWTQIYNVVGNNNLRRVAGYWRIADGSEGSTVSVASSGSGDWAANSYRISGGQGAPQAATAAAYSNTANAPSLSPSWALRIHSGSW